MASTVKSLLLLLSALLSAAIQASALDGQWEGRLSLGPYKIPLVFNFSCGTEAMQCTLDSPSQNATGIPMTVALCTADSLVLDCPAISATFRARIESGCISGKFTQRGIAMPLKLSPGIPVEKRRPQTPTPPFPYRVTDTVIATPDGSRLAATLTVPPGATDVPAVVMITGSGPQNRDEEIFGHRPFAVIADILARNGIASLRYDDRGTGLSTGDFATSTTYTFRDDAEAAVCFMRTIPGMGPVGVLGHSEGGTIALMLAADSIPDFAISLAGMAESGRATLMRQNARSLDKAGLSDADKEASLRLVELLFDAMADQSRRGPVDTDSLAAANGIRVPDAIISSIKATQKSNNPWFYTFITLEPAHILPHISVPVLALNGDKDTQVEADANIALIAGMIPHARTRILPGLNHLFQHATSGDPSEYAEIRETIAPEVLDIILSFIRHLPAHESSI